MLEKFRGTNEAEPQKQCESLARARVAFSMFLATLVNTPRKETVMKPAVFELGFQAFRMQLQP